MSATSLVAETVAAHGGAHAWSSREAIALRISAGGLAFASKWQGRAFRDLEARVPTRGQHTVYADYPGPGCRGVFDEGAVRIEAADGSVVAAREDARGAFRGPRHRLRWDRLDILYFAGYALWTYVSLPFVLERRGYEVRELEPWNDRGGRWRRLAVTFPQGVHTHSREQVLYIDDRGLIRRHDYTAEPFGNWAKAAHYLRDHRNVDGLTVAARREVFPRRRDNRPRRRPRLVWIDVRPPRS